MDIELCLAAPLLESAGRSPLHLRSALCTFRGAAPASPLGRSSIDVRLLESLPLLAVRTFRTPPAIRNAASSSHRRPQVHPLRVTVAFAGPSAPHLSVRFESVRTSVFWLTKSAAFHICLLCLCSYWCVYSALNTVCHFLYYIIGLSHTHIRSRLMPACAWVVIFFEHYITQSGSFFD